MKVNIRNIPKSLREGSAWCCWRYENREGKPTKVPYNPATGRRADSTDKRTFGTFEQACFAADLYGFDGIGVGIFDGLCAIDIDHCVENGVFSDMASEIFGLMNSYSEFSPSGTGLHIYFRAPGFVYDKAKYYINNQKIGLEVYCSGATNKFLTVTGNGLHNAGVNNRVEELKEILSRFMCRVVPQNRNTRSEYVPPAMQISLSDDLVIMKARAARNGQLFKQLMDGDTSAYDNDDSRADIALCNILAFWCNKDAAQMDRIFRSSGLMRPKWDRATAGSTYGAITIHDAIDRVRNTYSDLRNQERQVAMPVKQPRQRGDDTYGW